MSSPAKKSMTAKKDSVVKKDTVKNDFDFNIILDIMKIGEGYSELNLRVSGNEIEFSAKKSSFVENPYGFSTKPAMPVEEVVGSKTERILHPMDNKIKGQDFEDYDDEEDQEIDSRIKALRSMQNIEESLLLDPDRFIDGLKEGEFS